MGPERDTDHLIRDFTKSGRHLPHWQRPRACYFITFTLKVRHMCDLSRDDLASIVVGALRYYNGIRYDLYQYTVMPDHAHATLRPKGDHAGTEPLRRITGPLKGWTANRINKRLGRRGPLWLDESYDHIIRDEEDYGNRATYVWLNAFKAGLTDHPDRWPWFGNGQEELLDADDGRHS